METHRELCARCLRPTVVCYCAKIERLQTKTRVVILQHPRERRVPVSTARMAHLSLENSELHYGVDFSNDARIEALCQDPANAVLFPGPGAVSPEDLPEPPKHLIVVDGTWPLAKKVIRLNPALQRLPRIGLAPRRPSNYRIRKEPAEHCVSTIEAVCEVLGAMEHAHQRFDRMLEAFEYMVDVQLDYAKNRKGPLRYVLHKAPKPRVPVLFREEWPRLISLYAEANAHPRGEGFEDPGELVQIVAERPATRQRFEAIVKPRRQLSESTPFHMNLDAARLFEGEELNDALGRLFAFLRPDDVVCGWGYFALGLLAQEGVHFERTVDLRLPVMRVLRGRPGGIEAAAQKLGEPLGEITAHGRAGVRGAGLSAVLRALHQLAVDDAERLVHGRLAGVVAAR